MRLILKISLLTALALPFLTFVAGAQEDGQDLPDDVAPERPKTALERTREVEESEFSAQELLTAAIQQIQRREAYVVRARIKHKQAEIDPAKPGAGAQGVQIMVRAHGVGTEQNPFEGGVEVWRDQKGVSVIVSEKEFPGFGLYIDGDKTMRRLTYEDAAPGLNQLQAELLTLLDGRRLAAHLGNAKLEHRRDDASGDHIFAGTVSRDVVGPIRPVTDDPVANAMMAARITPRVLRAEVELRITKEGELKNAQFKIVHNDPAREMVQGRFGARIIIRGGAGGLVPVPEQEKKDGEDEKQDIEGVSAIYTLDLAAKEPSERAKAFKRDMQRIASK